MEAGYLAYLGVFVDLRVYTVRLTGISKEGRMEELLNQILIQLRIITVALIFVSILMIIHKIN